LFIYGRDWIFTESFAGMAEKQASVQIEKLHIAGDNKA
jgi:hypothetical protein